MKRKVFFISDRTGITAEMFGQSLLSQFDQVDFEETTLPFIDSTQKAAEACRLIEKAEKESGKRPIVFDTIVTPEIRKVIQASGALVLDFFHTFIGPLETELGETSGFRVGKTHSLSNEKAYDHRIEAVNFALNNDDGITTRHYDKADVILVGVSRCGKTPTSLYMAMQFGLRVANYPFIHDDLARLKLLPEFEIYRHKLFGLTIDAERLTEIRENRLAGSEYASDSQCLYELQTVEAMFRREAIPYINTSSLSVEEISTRILERTGLRRRLL